MAYEVSKEEISTAGKSIRDAVGPQAVDLAIRQAIATCWMMLPDDKKTIDTLETQVRRFLNHRARFSCTEQMESLFQYGE